MAAKSKRRFRRTLPQLLPGVALSSDMSDKFGVSVKRGATGNNSGAKGACQGARLAHLATDNTPASPSFIVRRSGNPPPLLPFSPAASMFLTRPFSRC